MAIRCSWAVALAVAGCGAPREAVVANVATRPWLDPLYAPLFERGRAWTLPCSHQFSDRHGEFPASCLGCEPLPALTCQVAEVRRDADGELAKIECNGRATWYAHRPDGLHWVDGPKNERVRPIVPLRPKNGVLIPKPYDEGRTVMGRWVGDRWCVDVHGGKANPPWDRWCFAPNLGLVGTFSTTAEASFATRCGQPL